MRVHHSPVFTLVKGNCYVNCTCGERLARQEGFNEKDANAIHRAHKDEAEWDAGVQRLRERGWVRA